MLTNTYTPVSFDKFNTLNGTTSAILGFARALVIDKPTRIASWELLNKEEQAHILGLKKTYTQQENVPNNTIEETAVIKVGDKVIWLNCWPHLSIWNPFIVENIEDDFAKLNNLLTPVPVEELSLVS